jgi:hypothetical protein
MANDPVPSPAPPGNSDPNPNPNPNPPAPPAAPEWLVSIQDPGLKENGSLKKFKDVPTLAQSYVALEKEMGSRVKFPDPKDEKASAEFWEKAGVPRGPEGYKFEEPKYPQGFPDQYKLDGEDLKEIAALCHQLRIPQSSAQGLVQHLVQRSVESAGTLIANKTQRRDAYMESLRGAWGVTFERNISLANRVVGTFDPDGKLRTVIEQKGWNMEPEFAMFMARIGHAMGERDLLVGEPTGSNVSPEALKAELAAIENNPKFWKGDLDKTEHSRLATRRSEIYKLLYSTP